MHLENSISGSYSVVNVQPLCSLVYNKNIGTVFRIQWKNSVVYDSGCKDCSKTHPVNLNHLHETIHGIFCKIRCVFSCKQTHIHTSVGENQQKHVLKNLRYRSAFPFIGIGSFQGWGNMKPCKKSFDRFRNLLIILSRLCYTFIYSMSLRFVIVFWQLNYTKTIGFMLFSCQLLLNFQGA